MRFVLVNGRTPCPQSFCLLCCELIGTSYLREIGTRLPYCDHNATPITAIGPSLLSKITREHHEWPSPYRVTEQSSLGGCERWFIDIAPLRTKGARPHRRRLE